MKKIIKNRKILIVLILGMFFVSCQFLMAKELEQKYPNLPGIGELTGDSTLPDLVAYIYSFAVVVAGIAVFFMLVLGGFKYLSSVGDPGKIKEAKDQITSSVLGLILLLSSFLILNTINPQLTTLVDPGKKIQEAFGRIETGTAGGFAKDDEIVLYENRNFQGDAVSVKIDQPENDLRDYTISGEKDGYFDRKASSVQLGENVDHAILCYDSIWRKCIFSLEEGDFRNLSFDNKTRSAVAGQGPGQGPCQGVTLFPYDDRGGWGYFQTITATQDSNGNWNQGPIDVNYGAFSFVTLPGQTFPTIPPNVPSSFSMEGSCVLTLSNDTVSQTFGTGDCELIDYDENRFPIYYNCVSVNAFTGLSTTIDVKHAPLVSTENAEIINTGPNTIAIELWGKLINDGSFSKDRFSVWFEYVQEDTGVPLYCSSGIKADSISTDDGTFKITLFLSDTFLIPDKIYRFRAVTGEKGQDPFCTTGGYKAYSYGDWQTFTAAIPKPE